MTKELALEMVKTLFLKVLYENTNKQHKERVIVFSYEDLQLLVRIINSID